MASSVITVGDVFVAGDSFTFYNGEAYSAYGFISGGTTEVVVTMILQKPCVATDFSLSGNVVLRGGLGYLNSMGASGVSISNYTINSKLVYKNIICFKIVNSSGFTDVNSNSPISLTGGSSTPLTITFS